MILSNFVIARQLQHDIACGVAIAMTEHKPWFNPPLQWRHSERVGVSNHQSRDCLLNRLFRRRSKKTSKLRVTGLCAGNSPVTGEFPAQRASNAENFSIWWRHHGNRHPYITCHTAEVWGYAETVLVHRRIHTRTYIYIIYWKLLLRMWNIVDLHYFCRRGFEFLCLDGTVPWVNEGKEYHRSYGFQPESMKMKWEMGCFYALCCVFDLSIGTFLVSKNGYWFVN